VGRAILDKRLTGIAMGSVWCNANQEQ